MILSFKHIKTASNDEWDLIWQNTLGATFFSSREWHEIWGKYTNGKIISCALIFEYSDGRSLLLPLQFYCGILHLRVRSPVAGVYGGWLTSDEITELHQKLLVDYLSHRFGDLTWRTNPFASSEVKTLNQENDLDFTYALNLTIGLNGIYSGFASGHRRAIARGLKQKLSVVTAVSIDQWKQYYTLYLQSMERWGNSVSSNYSWQLFYHLYKKQSSSIKLWIILRDQEILGGAILLYSQTHCSYWHGASATDALKDGIMPTLFHHIITTAYIDGITWFDFNPSGGHPGVMEFKRRFGCARLSCPFITIQDSKGRAQRTGIRIRDRLDASLRF